MQRLTARDDHNPIIDNPHQAVSRLKHSGVMRFQVGGILFINTD